jgi:phospholipase A1/A2
MSKLARQVCGLALCITAALFSSAAYAQDRQEPAHMASERFGSGIYAHEPIYIIGGGSPETDVRLQLSFKVRLYRDLYLGYTQNSHWDISGPSAPFRDTTYNPSVFWHQPILNARAPGDDPKTLEPYSLYAAAGIEHASNGKDATASRSMDTIFLRGIGSYSLSERAELRVTTKVFHYLQTSGNNSDIRRYRSGLDLEYGYFDKKTFGLGVTHRFGRSNRGSTQLDATYAMCELSLFKSWPGYFHIQVFSGYGETLIDYNVKKSTQVRFGYMIERVSGRNRQPKSCAT